MGRTIPAEIKPAPPTLRSSKGLLSHCGSLPGTGLRDSASVVSQGPEVHHRPKHVQSLFQMVSAPSLGWHIFLPIFQIKQAKKG